MHLKQINISSTLLNDTNIEQFLIQPDPSAPMYASKMAPPLTWDA